MRYRTCVGRQHCLRRNRGSDDASVNFESNSRFSLRPSKVAATLYCLTVRESADAKSPKGIFVTSQFLPMADTASTPSAKRVRSFDSNDMRASIFANRRTNSKTGEVFIVPTVQLTRSYEKDGTFQRTHSLRHRDLPDAIYVLEAADAFLDQQ